LASDWITRKTLLLRAVNDSSAWDEFLEYYGRFIYHIILKIGIKSSDADDVAQQILLQLWKSLKTYDSSKGNFRPWLSTVIRNAAKKHFTKESKRMERNDQHFQMFQHESDSDLEKMITNEWEGFLTEQALTKVKEIFSGKAVDVFLLSLEGLNHEQIGARLEIGTSSVKVLKSRVKTCFVNEMKRLISTMERQDD